VSCLLNFGSKQTPPAQPGCRVNLDAVGRNEDTNMTVFRDVPLATELSRLRPPALRPRLTTSLPFQCWLVRTLCAAKSPLWERADVCSSARPLGCDVRPCHEVVPVSRLLLAALPRAVAHRLDLPTLPRGAREPNTREPRTRALVWPVHRHRRPSPDGRNPLYATGKRCASRALLLLTLTDRYESLGAPAKGASGFCVLLGASVCQPPSETLARDDLR
jgi:hypothetical protein